MVAVELKEVEHEGADDDGENLDWTWSAYEGRVGKGNGMVKIEENGRAAGI